MGTQGREQKISIKGKGHVPNRGKRKREAAHKGKRAVDKKKKRAEVVYAVNGSTKKKKAAECKEGVEEKKICVHPGVPQQTKAKGVEPAAHFRESRANGGGKKEKKRLGQGGGSYHQRGKV